MYKYYVPDGMYLWHVRHLRFRGCHPLMAWTTGLMSLTCLSKWLTHMWFVGFSTLMMATKVICMLVVFSAAVVYEILCLPYKVIHSSGQCTFFVGCPLHGHCYHDHPRRGFLLCRQSHFGSWLWVVHRSRSFSVAHGLWHVFGFSAGLGRSCCRFPLWRSLCWTLAGQGFLG